MDHLLNMNKEYKSLKTLVIQTIYIYIYINELDKACFTHDVAYSDSKDLTKRTVADKILKIKHLILLKTQNMMDIKED